MTVTPRISGQILERHFEDGADVKKGDVLFVLDKAPSEASLATANAAVAQAKASQAFSKIELERYAAVAGTKAISKSDYDTKSNAVDVAKAQVDAAEAQVRSFQINLDFCTIRSPLTGRLGARMVDVGNVVKENETALLGIQQLDPIYADFTVNEQELGQVRQNMSGGTLHAFVRVPADGESKGREGTLTFLDNSVQDASGTVRLRVTMPNKDLHFWPGQFVTVRLVLKTLDDAVLVPTAAQQLSQKGPFVFVVKDDQSAEIRPIVVGQMQGDQVVIAHGLRAGEKVITDGQMMVRPGGKVSVIPGAAVANGTPNAGGGTNGSGNGGSGNGDNGTPGGNASGGAPTTQAASAGQGNS